MVKEKKTGKLFAMKCVKKKQKKDLNLENEINVLRRWLFFSLTQCSVYTSWFLFHVIYDENMAISAESNTITSWGWRISMRLGPIIISSCSCEFFILKWASANKKRGQGLMIVVCLDQSFRWRTLWPYPGPWRVLREGRQQRDPAGPAGCELPAPKRDRASWPEGADHTILHFFFIYNSVLNIWKVYKVSSLKLAGSCLISFL